MRRKIRKRITFTLEKKLIDKLEQESKQEDRSKSMQLEYILDRYFSKDSKKS